MIDRGDRRPAPARRIGTPPARRPVVSGAEASPPAPPRGCARRRPARSTRGSIPYGSAHRPHEGLTKTSGPVRTSRIGGARTAPAGPGTQQQPLQRTEPNTEATIQLTTDENNSAAAAIRIGSIVARATAIPVPVTDPHREPVRGEIVAINQSREPQEYLVRFLGNSTKIFTADQLEKITTPKEWGPQHRVEIVERDYLTTAARIAMLNKGGLSAPPSEIEARERQLQLLSFHSDLTPTLVKLKLQSEVDRLAFTWEVERFDVIFPVATELGDIPHPQRLQELLIQLRAIQAEPPKRYADAFARLVRPFELNLGSWYGVTPAQLKTALKPVIDDRVAQGIVGSLARPKRGRGKSVRTRASGPGRPTIAEELQRDFPGLKRPITGGSQPVRATPPPRSRKNPPGKGQTMPSP